MNIQLSIKNNPMKAIRLLLIVFFIITFPPFAPLQAAVIYESHSEASPSKTKKKAKKTKKLKRIKRRSYLKKVSKATQTHKQPSTPEGKKSLTYFILTAVAVMFAMALFIASLSFLFTITPTLGIFLGILSIAFLISAIVFSVNGIMYFNKAIKLKTSS